MGLLCCSESLDHLRILEQLLRFWPVLYLDLLVVEEVLLLAFVVVDLEAVTI